jgi:hypothetical protein
MGIRFSCPSGHKLNVKSFLAGKRAICPQCGAKVIVPDASEAAVTAPPRQDAGIYEMSGNSTAGSNSSSSSVAVELAESTGTFSAVADDLELAMPESIVAASSLPAAVIEPIATEPRIEQELRRARSRRNQMAVAIIMFMVVLVLAGVFVWVLRREAASMKAQEIPPADVQVPEKETEKSTRINRSVQIAFAMCECEFTSLIERG